jgi:hypothetical protein
MTVVLLAGLAATVMAFLRSPVAGVLSASAAICLMAGYLCWIVASLSWQFDMPEGTGTLMRIVAGLVAGLGWALVGAATLAGRSAPDLAGQ